MHWFFFQILFWSETLCFGQFLCSILILSESFLQTCMTYTIAVYGEKLLMMDKGTVRNM
jgi:hypothetical protein